MRYAEMTWPQLRDVPRNVVVLAPFGACEQHGPFLPFFTDAILLEAVATRAEAQLGDDVLLLPTQWFGASQHHLPYGALTADVKTHAQLILETCESILQANFTKLFVLNGHGGNIDTMHLALRQLDLRYPEATLAAASYWDVAAEEIASLLEGPLKRVGHACELETSLMLHVRPDLVRREQIQDDHNFPVTALRGVSLFRSSAEWGKVGGEGYATFATAEKGRRLMDAIVARVVTVTRELRRTRPDGTPG